MTSQLSTPGDNPVRWQDRAKCRDVPTWVMYPEVTDRIGVERAEGVCFGCPVIAECAQAGRHERDGVWGGVLHVQRQRGRRSPVYA